MIRLTNLADYGVVAMSVLADCKVKGLTPISAQDLSQRSGIPAPTVSKLMGALARAGLLNSHRGLHGGFDLARAAEDISVGDIIEAVDGPIALTNCIEEAPGDCTLSEICTIKAPWQRINQAVKGALSSVSLAEIAGTQPIPVEIRSAETQSNLAAE